MEARPPAKSPARPHSLTREGDVWRMNFSGTEARIADLKGLHDLSRLLSNPREPVHCTDLMGAVSLAPGEQVIDERAKAEYRQRILALQDEINDAETSANGDRLSALQEEYDLLLEHLSSAVGKGGNSRKSGGTVEKCRAAVTWRIRSAIKKIEEAHPALGRHLSLSVKTGVFCEYTPEWEMNWLIGNSV